MPNSGQTDAALVAQCLAGHRGAFEQIVTRYQSLICSLAYSATGSLNQSEDLAQETFVAAWKQLRDLREPEKLRAWLCGIARNLTHSALRKRGRESLRVTEGSDVDKSATLEPSPTEQTISREEERILWQSLERIPETYREPLVLFYRQHQSVERVAEALDITHETARQRLSRGRKLLREQVLAFVEGTLERTKPGKAFTVAVLAALPVLAPQAAIAGVAATAAKGSSLAKGAGLAGLTGTLFGPLLGLLGAWFGVHMSIKNTKSPRERQFMIGMTWKAVGLVAVFGVLIVGIILFGRTLAASHPVLLGGLIAVVTVLYIAALFALILWGNRRQREIQIEDGTYVSPRQALTNAEARPSRGAILGSLGGSILGGTLWMAILAARAADWSGLAIVVLTAIVIFILSTRFCLRHSDQYFPAVAASAAALGILALAMVNWRWSQWAAEEVQLRNWSALGFSVLIGLVYGGVAVFLFCKRKSNAPAAPGNNADRKRTTPGSS